MPGLNFKRQFVQPIRDRRKRHTIRAKRKYPIKVGDALYLFTGMRTKHCERILDEKLVCSRVQDILLVIGKTGNTLVYIDAVLLSDLEREELAVADGFESWAEMRTFWDGRLNRETPQWEGDIIHWREA